jgi:hypothetical protein
MPSTPFDFHRALGLPPGYPFSDAERLEMLEKAKEREARDPRGELRAPGASK